MLYFFYAFAMSIKNKSLAEALVMLSFYPTIASVSGITQLKTVVYIVLLLILLAFILISRKEFNKLETNIIKTSYLFFLVLFVFLFAFKTIFSKAIGHGYYFNKLLFSILFIIIPIMLFQFLASRNNNYKVLVKFFKVTATIMALSLLLTAYNMGLAKIFNGNFFPRISTSDVTNAIWLGRFLSIGFIINLIFTKKKFYKAILAVLLLISMIFTGSKSVLLFTFVTVFIYYNFINSEKSFKTKLRNLAMIIAIIGFGIYILLSLNPLAFERRFSTNSETIDDRQGRYEMVFDAYLSEGNFFFGNGLGSTTYPLTSGYAERSYPHNIYIEILYEFGFVGFLIFNGLLLSPIFFAMLKKRRPREIDTFATISILFILYAQTSGDLFANNLMFVFVSYLVCLTPIMHKNEDSLS